MSIKAYIQHEILLPRLRTADILVVYDPDRRYRDLCLELATDKRPVIDATDSSIASREQALATLQILGRANPPIDGMLIYVPARAPRSDEEKQLDPFAFYGEIGQIFPNPHDDGDEFQSICLKALPEHGTEIRRIFAETQNPDFAVIDAVGGPGGWPILQAALDVESTRNILSALLAPSTEQRNGLKAQAGWLTEAKTLFQNALGLTLLTKSTSWKTVADELWRYVLFSEFTFDLPAALPPELANVPHAPEAARPVIEELCDGLRNDRRTESIYIEHAETIEREFDLPARCAHITDLGQRDTFPFEERSFFTQAVAALQADDMDRVRAILDRHTSSVWMGRDQSQLQWNLFRAAVRLIEACADAEALLPDHVRTQDGLVAFYVTQLREADQLQREFEQSAADDLDTASVLQEVIEQARNSYRRLADNVQSHFIRHLEREGWPASGYPANADVFDTVVAPQLQESGRRVALLLIDALRYELGVALQRTLAEEHHADVQPACAQLPTVTPVGMASLLPGAGLTLELKQQNGKPAPMVQGQSIVTVGARMSLLRERYGHRFAELPLSDFVRNRRALPETTELLALRSNEMDNDFESNPDAALGNIRRTFQLIQQAVYQLRDLGFQDVFIVTDHGFYLNPIVEAGDACAKPPGNWMVIHERMLLGDGSPDPAHFVVSAEKLGIRGDYRQAAGPRAMVAYRAGQSYFHGGASLQEAIVPVISVRLQPAQPEAISKPTVSLSYKRGAKQITTRRPVIEVTVDGGDLFSLDTSVDIRLEAQDADGKVVGEVRPGGPVDPATLTLTLDPGAVAKVTLVMDEEFEGKFSVKALDPTTLTTYDKLDLKTDYTV